MPLREGLDRPRPAKAPTARQQVTPCVTTHAHLTLRAGLTRSKTQASLPTEDLSRMMSGASKQGPKVQPLQTFQRRLTGKPCTTLRAHTLDPMPALATSSRLQHTWLTQRHLCTEKAPRARLPPKTCTPPCNCREAASLRSTQPNGFPPWLEGLTAKYWRLGPQLTKSKDPCTTGLIPLLSCTRTSCRFRPFTPHPGPSRAPTANTGGPGGPHVWGLVLLHGKIKCFLTKTRQPHKSIKQEAVWAKARGQASVGHSQTAGHSNRASMGLQVQAPKQQGWMSIEAPLSARAAITH